jgi:hypothetical protein
MLGGAYCWSLPFPGTTAILGMAQRILQPGTTSSRGSIVRWARLPWRLTAAAQWASVLHNLESISDSCL